MNRGLSWSALAAVLALACALVVYRAYPGLGSDHQDSPTVTGNPLADITDVFAFPAADNPNNVVLAMNVDPLIPAGMFSGQALDPNVLYQFKIANNVAAADFAEHLVIQFRAGTSGTNQTITMYGPAAPNETGTTNTLVAQTGTFSFNTPSTIDSGQVQVFAGPRRDPFFFDLAQFFKIVPDRNYQNQPSPPPATATSFNFATASQPIILNGTSFGTAASNGCTIATPTDFLANFDVLSIVVELPKTMLAPAGGQAGKIGVWATTSTPDGQSE